MHINLAIIKNIPNLAEVFEKERMKKVLFLIFHGFDPNNGISKKISYQVDAFKKCGMNVHLCYMDEKDTKKRIIDGDVIADYGNGLLSKILKRTDFSAISNYVKKNQIDMVYIRSNHNANLFTINMVKNVLDGDDLHLALLDLGNTNIPL